MASQVTFVWWWCYAVRMISPPSQESNKLFHHFLLLLYFMFYFFKIAELALSSEGPNGAPFPQDAHSCSPIAHSSSAPHVTSIYPQASPPGYLQESLTLPEWLEYCRLHHYFLPTLKSGACHRADSSLWMPTPPQLWVLKWEGGPGVRRIERNRANIQILTI